MTIRARLGASARGTPRVPPPAAAGSQGAQGARGAQGFQGAPGAQGFQGSVGAQGFQGATGTQVVADLAALALVPNSQNGASVYVLDQGESYRLDTANTFVASSPLIIAALGGGRWFRRSKAYVVGNFFLWICNTSGFVANDALVGGFGPGQQAAGAVAPDILIDLNALTASEGSFLDGVTVDNLGNLWALAFHHTPTGVTTWVHKLALADVLQSGSPTPRVTITNSLANSGGQQVVFDKTNALYLSIFTVAGNTGCTIKKYGAASYATSGAPTPEWTIVTTNVVPGEFQDALFDAQGNFWVSCFTGGPDPSGGMQMVSSAQLAAGANPALVAAVSWTGTNFLRPIGMAFGPTGLLWAANYAIGGGAASRLRAWVYQAAASGNPAPAIDIAVTGANGLVALAFTPEGDAWVIAQDDSKTVLLTAAQLAASGTVAAGRSLIVGPGFPQTIMFPNNPYRSGLVPSGVPLIP